MTDLKCSWYSWCCKVMLRESRMETAGMFPLCQHPWSYG